ncbi:MAG TPA: hypothetical protein VF686_06320 [Brevundimonas sp.]
MKKIVLASMLAASAIVTMPTAALADTDDACMLRNGCVWASGNDSNPGYWQCRSPAVYARCVSPEGGPEDPSLTFKPIKD